jgi:hypothetical protein
MSEEFLRVLEERLEAAKARLARAVEESRFSRSEIEYLSGLLKLEESRAAIEAAATKSLPRPEEVTVPELTAAGANPVRDFLIKTLPVRAPGKHLQQLVSEAEDAHLVEDGKSPARSLNANLLSMHTLKLVSRDAEGGWIRLVGPPAGGVFR